MDELILIGGGGHCKSCIDVIEKENRFKIVGIIDIPNKIGQSVLNYPIIGSDQDLPELTKSYNYFFISIGQIGNPGIRMQVYEKIKSFDVTLPVIISPYSYVSKHSKLGEGSIIMHGVIVNAGAVVGKNCIINSQSLIEHDVIIGDFVHIATGSLINGGVTIGDESFIGSGTVCKQYSVISKGAFIKAHSLIK